VSDKILLPREIAGVIGHTEENLKPFYTYLEHMHDRLRSKVRASHPDCRATVVPTALVTQDPKRTLAPLAADAQGSVARSARL
jgi:hypothetical protein